MLPALIILQELSERLKECIMAGLMQAAAEYKALEAHNEVLCNHLGPSSPR